MKSDVPLDFVCSSRKKNFSSPPPGTLPRKIPLSTCAAQTGLKPPAVKNGGSRYMKPLNPYPSSFDLVKRRCDEASFQQLGSPISVEVLQHPPTALAWSGDQEKQKTNDSGVAPKTVVPARAFHR